MSEDTAQYSLTPTIHVLRVRPYQDGRTDLPIVVAEKKGHMWTVSKCARGGEAARVDVVHGHPEPFKL